MRRSFKFQARPTRKQQVALTAMLADHAHLYNAALQERRDSWRQSRVSTTYGVQSAQLRDIRATDPGGQGRWSFTSQQQTLRRLDKAFARFFDRVQNGQVPGYPRFRSINRFDTVDFVEGDGARWDSTQVRRGRNKYTGSSTWTHVYLHGIGHIKVNQHRAVPGGARVKQVAIKREGTLSRPRWYVIVSCENVPTDPLPATGRTVGLDLATGANGLAWTVALDETTGGTTTGYIPGARAYHRAQNALAQAQRAAQASRPKPGQRASARHRRNTDRVRALHAKVTRIRHDHLHKQARALVEANDVIVIEDLRTANMTRRPAPKPDPDNPGTWLPNKAAAAAGRNKSILDSAWATFTQMLHDKAECAGRQVIKVNPAYTSQTCHRCQNIDAEARDDKTYACTRTTCGWVGDADLNAAHNILRAGLVLLDGDSS